ncbi:unnamed protein product, partial [Darwinula stevensoni]
MEACGAVGKRIAMAIPVLLGVAIYLHKEDPSYLAVLYRIPGMGQLARFWAGGEEMWEKSPEGPPRAGRGRQWADGERGDGSLRDLLFAPEELAKYNGRKKRELYLAILGRVYDVSSARNYYGKGGFYEPFTGRDASRAFLTGDFSDGGLTDEVSGLTDEDYRALDEQADFYDSKYKYVGKVMGRYFDERGKMTAYGKQVERWIREAKAAEELQDARAFPPCHSEWKQGQPPRVWCDRRSGGIVRDWAGVPRKVDTPGGGTRCVCVRNTGTPTHRYAGADDRGDLE